MYKIQQKEGSENYELFKETELLDVDGRKFIVNAFVGVYDVNELSSTINMLQTQIQDALTNLEDLNIKLEEINTFIADGEKNSKENLIIKSEVEKIIK